MLPVCRHIAEIGYVGIDGGLFPDEYKVIGILDSIIVVAHKALRYRRQRRNVWEGHGLTQSLPYVVVFTFVYLACIIYWFG